MKISEILTRIVSGAELTPEEKNFLAAYQEPDLKDRIPKSQLDQELTRKKELEQQLEEMAHRIEDYETRGLSDGEKSQKVIENLNKRVEILLRERDEIRSAKNELETRSRISAMAGEFNFDDSNYLEFLIKRDHQEVTDEEGLRNYIAGLKKSCPKHFRVDAGPGGGAGGEKISQADAEFASAKTSGDIDRMIANAPAI